MSSTTMLYLVLSPHHREHGRRTQTVTTNNQVEGEQQQWRTQRCYWHSTTQM